MRHTFERLILKNMGIKRLPIIHRDYLICPECGQSFGSSNYEKYGKHAKQHKSLRYKET